MTTKVPEEGQLVVGKVTAVKDFGAFVQLEEFSNAMALIHLREIAPGRIRTVRDYVRENQRIVARVVGVDPQKGYVDLSLRNISRYQRIQAIKEWKDSKKAKKLLEELARTLRLPLDKCYTLFVDELIKKYDSFAGAFEAAAQSPEEFRMENFGKWVDEFIKLAKENIQIPKVQITGELHLSSPEKDGVERIKKVCGEIDRNGEKVKVRINYLSAPLYELNVEATNFKDAEAELKDTLIRTKNLAKELNLDISFQRKGKRNE